MRRPGVKIWLIGVIGVAFVTASLAYVLTGTKWPVGTNVGYYVNPNTLQVSNEEDAVRSAANSWSQINPAGLKLSYIGSTSETGHGLNGLNTICWQNEGNTSTLATAYWWSSGTRTIEADMVFNDYQTWSTSGGNYDIETVALHELGHWVGLAHSSTGIMRPYYGGIQRSIDSDARAGFEAMYGTGPSHEPWIELDTTSLSFTGKEEKTFRVRNSGEGTLNYQISVDKSWLGVSPTSGSSTGEWDLITASTDVSGLSPGNYSGSITVSSGDAPNSPQKLSVSLTVSKDSPPTVSIVSPKDGDVVNKIVTIKVKASDDKGIAKVEFYIDNVLKNRDTNFPYEWDWDTDNYSSGFHSIKVIAYDTIGQTDEAQIQLKVDKPPHISISSPAPGVSVFGIISIKASASDDFGIKKVQFFINNVLQLTDNSAPYECKWDTGDYSSGFHSIKVKAYDTIDQTDEAQIRLKVDKPPHVSISNPASGASVFGIVSIEVSASDDFGIKKVQFFVNNVLQLTDDNAPYECNWDTSSLPNGNYNLKAVVTDLVGQTAEHTINVYVLPHPPLDFSGVKQNNSSTLLEQYIMVLSWQANSLNRDINKYRLYLKEGDNWKMLVELDGNTFVYWHWNIEKEKKYTYVIRAFDASGKEGEAAQIDVQ